MERFARPAVSWTVLPIALLATSTLDAQQLTNRDSSTVSELHEEGVPVKLAGSAVPAGEASLFDTELVLGVVAGGEARAYALNSLFHKENEVLNDILGETPIAATWCPVAHSGAVYARTLDQRELELGVIGLDRGALVMYDRDTRSWWSQVTGEATEGALAGHRLEKVPSVVTTWERWRRQYPETTVYVVPGVARRLRFTQDSWAPMTLGGGPIRNEDWVVGVEAGSMARAYLVRKLSGTRVVNDTLAALPLVVFLAEDSVTVRVLSRTVEGRLLSFAAEGERLVDEQTRSVWDPMTGLALSGPLEGRVLEAVVSTSSLWYAWKRLHPNTELWPEEPKASPQ
jgi:Protein of unknown function (DUF3179)